MVDIARKPSYTAYLNPNDDEDEAFIDPTQSQLIHPARRPQYIKPHNGNNTFNYSTPMAPFLTTRYITETRFTVPIIPSYFIRIIETLSMQDTALSFIPARIGFDHTVDLAAHALLSLLLLSKTPGTACTAPHFGSSDDGALTKSEYHYAQAVSALRLSLDSRTSSQGDGGESSILTIYLLIVFDLLYSSRRNSYSARRAQAESHGRGLVALLKTRVNAVQRSPVRLGGTRGGELLRTFVYEAWSASFTGPCIRGEPSAFDCPALYTLDPPVHYGLPTALAQLLRSGNELIIRMPRLISALGELRCGDELTSDRGVKPFFVSLAAELYGVRDDEGEDALLHHLKIRPIAKDSLSSCPLSCFFYFSRISEFKTAILYWSGRLMIQRINFLLHRHGRDILIPGTSTQLLHAQAEATAINILMCVEHGRQLGFHASKLLLIALSSAWGLLNELPTFRSKPSAEMKSYIHATLAGMGEHVAVTRTELDFIAESFVGGPTGGLKLPVLDPIYGI